MNLMTSAWFLVLYNVMYVGSEQYGNFRDRTHKKIILLLLFTKIEYSPNTQRIGWKKILLNKMKAQFYGILSENELKPRNKNNKT